MEAQALDLVQKRKEATRYVSANSLHVRREPKGTSDSFGKIVYRTSVVVLQRSGDWEEVNVSGGGRGWVYSSFLSKTLPPLKQTTTRTSVSNDNCGTDNRYARKYYDRRIQCNAISSIGRDRLSEYDVETLWMGAEKVLSFGQCGEVVDGGKSYSKVGAYYINCSKQKKNQFFFRRGDIIGLQ